MMTGMVATQPEKLWDVDLDHLRSQITAETVGIIVTNPSNPCGSVYTADHLKAIIKGDYTLRPCPLATAQPTASCAEHVSLPSVAEEAHVPIIADEVYAHMVFSNATFHALAPLADSVSVA